MPAAWARMIYVCGFLQDKGVLYRIRRPATCAVFCPRSCARKFMHFSRVSRAKSARSPRGRITRVHVKELPLILDPQRCPQNFNDGE